MTLRRLHDTCLHCGGDPGIHQYKTHQCPVGGVESPFDRPQEWETSTYEPVPFAPPDRLARDMTLRERFAADAMKGMGYAMKSDSNYSKLDRDALRPEKDAKGIATAAVRYADALIEALNKEVE